MPPEAWEAAVLESPMPKLAKNRLNETGAVGSVSQAGAAINIGITHKLYRVGSDLLTKI